MKRLPILAGAWLLLASVVATAARPAVEDADRAALVKGNNAFALDLYGQLRTREGNLFFSPYSISSAFAMAYAGARGDTAEQMEKVLHLTLGPRRLHPAFGSLGRELAGRGKGRGYDLSVANALWGQKDYGFLPGFLSTTRAHYGAGLKEVDFREDPDGARQTVNSWAEEETRGKIKDLIPGGLVNPDTRFILASAIYFKGEWVNRFDKKQTREERFRTTPDGGKDVPMMHQRDREFRYAHDRSVQVLEMPYLGGELSMVVILPRNVDGLAEVEKGLSPEGLEAWLGKLAPEEGNVSLPKFRLTEGLDLKKVLSGMGMASAFSPGADFSGVNDRHRLFLMFAVHKAFVDVNEEGTEAAAATAVGGGEEAEPETFRFRADHPFLFLIRDRRSGAILFLGRLADPKA